MPYIITARSATEATRISFVSNSSPECGGNLLLPLIIGLVVSCEYCGCGTSTKKGTGESKDSAYSDNGIVVNFTLDDFENDITSFGALVMKVRSLNDLGFSYNFNYGMDLFVNPHVANSSDEEFRNKMANVESLIFQNILRVRKLFADNASKLRKRRLVGHKIGNRYIHTNREYKLVTEGVLSMLVIFELLAQVRIDATEEQFPKTTENNVANLVPDTVSPPLSSIPPPAVQKSNNMYYLGLLEKFLTNLNSSLFTKFGEYQRIFLDQSLVLCSVIPFEQMPVDGTDDESSSAGDSSSTESSSSETTETSEDDNNNGEQEEGSNSSKESKTTGGTTDTNQEMTPTVYESLTPEEQAKRDNEYRKYLNYPKRKKCILASYMALKNVIFVSELFPIVSSTTATSKALDIGSRFANVLESLITNQIGASKKSLSDAELIQITGPSLSTLRLIAKSIFPKPPSIDALTHEGWAWDGDIVVSSIPDTTGLPKQLSPVEVEAGIENLRLEWENSLGESIAKVPK